MSNRTEHDLLGSREIPSDAFYGIQTLRAMENFPVSGRPVNRRLLQAGALVKMACARANVRCGYLATGIGEAIESACEAVATGEHDDSFPVDALQGGAGTSTNMNWNEVIANIASKQSGLEITPHEHVNLHQSTNDVFPTAVKVAAISAFGDLEVAVISLLEALQAKERAFADVVKLGRTQLRDAVPTTLGREFGAWATAVGRDRWRISKCVERLRVVNLGGTAIGTGITAPRKYIFCAVECLREITGMNLARAENLIDATMNTDPFVEVSGILKSHASILCKVARDLRIISSGPNGGLAEIELPAVQPGSSIMPGKINPVIPEMVMQVAFRVMANDHGVTLAASSGELELNPFLPLLADSLLENLDMLACCDKILADKCIEGIVAFPERCRDMMERSAEIVTALIPVTGHEVAVELAKKMQAENVTVRQAALECTELTEQQLDQLLSAEALCALGTRERDDA